MEGSAAGRRRPAGTAHAAAPSSLPPRRTNTFPRTVAPRARLPARYILLALFLLALLAAPAVGAPSNGGAHPDSPVRFVPPAAALSGAQGKISTDLLGLVDDRFLPPNQSHGDVVAALARSGRFAKAGQRHRAVDTPSVDLVEVYIRTEPGTGAAAVRSFVDRVSAEDASAGIVAAWVAPAGSSSSRGFRRSARSVRFSSRASARARSRARGTCFSAPPSSGMSRGSRAPESKSA